MKLVKIIFAVSSKFSGTKINLGGGDDSTLDEILAIASARDKEEMKNAVLHMLEMQIYDAMTKHYGEIVWKFVTAKSIEDAVKIITPPLQEFMECMSGPGSSGIKALLQKELKDPLQNLVKGVLMSIENL